MFGSVEEDLARIAGQVGQVINPGGGSVPTMQFRSREDRAVRALANTLELQRQMWEVQSDPGTRSRIEDGMRSKMPQAAQVLEGGRPAGVTQETWELLQAGAGRVAQIIGAGGAPGGALPMMASGSGVGRLAVMGGLGLAAFLGIRWFLKRRKKGRSKTRSR